ncbi:hypothetical protein LINPERHAP1_LOCUS23837 [Linum perenne]
MGIILRQYRNINFGLVDSFNQRGPYSLSLTHFIIILESVNFGMNEETIKDFSYLIASVWASKAQEHLVLHGRKRQ